MPQGEDYVQELYSATFPSWLLGVTLRSKSICLTWRGESTPVIFTELMRTNHVTCLLEDNVLTQPNICLIKGQPIRKHLFAKLRTSLWQLNARFGFGITVIKVTLCSDWCQSLQSSRHDLPFPAPGAWASHSISSRELAVINEEMHTPSCCQTAIKRVTGEE